MEACNIYNLISEQESKVYFLHTNICSVKSIPVTHNNEVCVVTQSRATLCDPMDCSLPATSVHGDSPGKNTGVGCHFLFQVMKSKAIEIGYYPWPGLLLSGPQATPNPF